MSTANVLTSIVLQDPAAVLELCAAVFTAMYLLRLSTGGLRTGGLRTGGLSKAGLSTGGLGSGAQNTESPSAASIGSSQGSPLVVSPLNSPIMRALQQRQVEESLAFDSSVRKSSRLASVGALISLPKRSLRWQTLRCLRRTEGLTHTHRLLPAR